jgi:hypothetical protein
VSDWCNPCLRGIPNADGMSCVGSHHAVDFQLSADGQALHLELALVGKRGDTFGLIEGRELLDGLRVGLAGAETAAGHGLDSGDDPWRPTADEVGKPVFKGKTALSYHIAEEFLWPVGGLNV